MKLGYEMIKGKEEYCYRFSVFYDFINILGYIIIVFFNFIMYFIIRKDIFYLKVIYCVLIRFFVTF